MTVLRSLFFVPGNQPRMLEQASDLKPDAFIPDMEDSMPIDKKIKAPSSNVFRYLRGSRCEPAPSATRHRRRALLAGAIAQADPVVQIAPGGNPNGNSIVIAQT